MGAIVLIGLGLLFLLSELDVFHGQLFRYAWPLLLGSSWDREIARELGACHLSIAAPITDRLVLDRSYLGYRGGLALIEDLYTSILASVQ